MFIIVGSTVSGFHSAVMTKGSEDAETKNRSRHTGSLQLEHVVKSTDDFVSDIWETRVQISRETGAHSELVVRVFSDRASQGVFGFSCGKFPVSFQGKKIVLWVICR
jgi:hypothetical protein